MSRSRTKKEELAYRQLSIDLKRSETRQTDMLVVKDAREYRVRSHCRYCLRDSTINLRQRLEKVAEEGDSNGCADDHN